MRRESWRPTRAPRYPGNEAAAGPAGPSQPPWSPQFTEAATARKIYAWCRRWNLQGADAEDLTQDVLLKLAEKMQTFVYDPAKSFRGWLKTVARHAWSDSWSGRKAGVAAGGSLALELLQTVEARDDLVRRLEEEFDRELLDRPRHGRGCGCASSRGRGRRSSGPPSRASPARLRARRWA